MKQKERILVIRLGAYGDNIIVSPVLKYIKDRGDEVYFMTSDQGTELMKHDPNIDKLIPYVKDSVLPSKLGEFFEATKKGYECDRMIDMCESIERKLALHWRDPECNLPKKDRVAMCNKNYYYYAFEHAKLPMPAIPPRGELYFKKEETDWAEKLMGKYKGKFVILWGLSGSGRNKTYPFADYVMGSLIKRYADLMIITVGDEVCKILECGSSHPNLIRMSGLWNFRQSALLTKYVNLVVSPDTGLLHASGCFDTPKIGLLGHSTVKNVTETFLNDYSLEAKCECAPCFRLIYSAPVQCPIDPISRGTYCMTTGMDSKRVFNHIRDVVDKLYYDRRK